MVPVVDMFIIKGMTEAIRTYNFMVVKIHPATVRPNRDSTESNAHNFLKTHILSLENDIENFEPCVLFAMFTKPYQVDECAR